MNAVNNPSPFIPQGSFLERQQRLGRPKVKLVVFVVLGFHVVVLLAMMLIQGCRHNQEADATAQFASSNSAPSSPITNEPTIGLPVQVQTSTVPMIAEPAAPSEAVATKAYRVVKGDTLGKIAKRHSVSLSAVKQANPGIDSTRLQVGQVLQLPEKTKVSFAPTQTSRSATSVQGSVSRGQIYLVKRDDTLLTIASANGTTVKAIRNLNHLKSDQLIVGRKLKLPPHATLAAKPGRAEGSE